MDWGGAQLAVDLVPGTGSAAYVLLPTDVRTFFTDPTLIRTLLYSTMLSTTEAAGSGIAAVGVIAWDDVDDSPDDIPLPVTDSNLDWIIRQCHPYAAGEGLSTETTFPNCDMIFQSKAMRKLGNQKGVLVCMENNLLTGAGAGYRFVVDVRVLLKE